MPCMCWYHPKDEKLQELKKRCQSVSDYVRELGRDGDPVGGELKDALKLIKHLYTGECEERP